jgi:hypothetical protein
MATSCLTIIFVCRTRPCGAAQPHDRKATWSTGNPEGRWRVDEYADVIAQETVDDLEAALEPFRLIAG